VVHQLTGDLIAMRMYAQTVKNQIVRDTMSLAI